MDFGDGGEQVLTATWTPQEGLSVTSTDLPEPWLIALRKVAKDLQVRQYGGTIEHVEWVALHDSDGMVPLYSAITVGGYPASELGGTGTGARIDDDDETVVFWVAEMVQNAVSRSGTAWPWGDEGGFMNPRLVDGVAVWIDRSGRAMRIGDLVERD